ncbi:MAG: DUF3306 domain-containing protein [Granulosicoccus sp.]
MSGTQETFAGRWSRRKQAVAAESDTAFVTVPVRAAVAVPVDIANQTITGTGIAPTPELGGSLPDAGSSDAVQANEIVLTDADMPSIDSLDSDSEISGFFSEGVSAALRQSALRRIFSLPVYNVRDGLNDYDGDYTVFEPLGDTVTSDMKFHTARKERERLLALEEEREATEASAEEARVSSQEQPASVEETSAAESPDETAGDAADHESGVLESAADTDDLIQVDTRETIDLSDPIPQDTDNA